MEVVLIGRLGIGIWQSVRHERAEGDRLTLHHAHDVSRRHLSPSDMERQAPFPEVDAAITGGGQKLGVFGGPEAGRTYRPRSPRRRRISLGVSHAWMAGPGDTQTNPSKDGRVSIVLRVEERLRQDRWVNGKTSEDEKLERSRRFRLLDRRKGQVCSSFVSSTSHTSVSRAPQQDTAR